METERQGKESSQKGYLRKLQELIYSTGDRINKYLDKIGEHYEQQKMEMVYSLMDTSDRLNIAREFFRSPETINSISPELLKLILKDFVFLHYQEKRKFNSYDKKGEDYEALCFFHPSINDGIEDNKQKIFPDKFFKEFGKLAIEYRKVWQEHVIDNIPENIGASTEISLNVDIDLIDWTINLLKKKGIKNVHIELLETIPDDQQEEKDIGATIKRAKESGIEIAFDDVGGDDGHFTCKKATELLRNETIGENLSIIKIDKHKLWEILNIFLKLAGGKTEKRIYEWDEEYGVLSGLDLNIIIEDYGSSLEEKEKYNLVEFIELIKICIQKQKKIVYEGIEDKRMVKFLDKLVIYINGGEEYGEQYAQGYDILNPRYNRNVYDEDNKEIIEMNNEEVLFPMIRKGDFRNED